jgi:hypothetical protein
MAISGNRRQVIGRVPSQISNRWGGYHAERLCVAFGASAIWNTMDAWSIVLNGSDVSAIVDATSAWPRPVDATVYTLTQATPANQPLGTGAPAYNGWPSIQYVRANADRLARANTNLAASDITIISVQRLADTTTSYFVSNVDGGGTTGLALGVSAALRDVVDANAGNHNGGTPSVAVPEVWIAREVFGQSPTLLVNGVSVALTGAATRIATTAAATFTIGSLAGAGFPQSMDDMFKSVFLTSIPDSVAIRISHALGAAAGISA